MPSRLSSAMELVEIVERGHRVQNEVESCLRVSPSHLLRVLRDHDFMGAVGACPSSLILPGDVVNRTTCAPSAAAIFTPMCPSRQADDAHLLPLLRTFQCFSGE